MNKCIAGLWNPLSTHEMEELCKLRIGMIKDINGKIDVVEVSCDTEFNIIQEYRKCSGFESSALGAFDKTYPIYISVDPNIGAWSVQNHGAEGFGTVYNFKEFYETFFPQDIESKIELYTIKAPEYYDNSKGSLYKISADRGWNSYVFDVVKRLERGGKKDPLRQEIEKSIVVLQLWLKEMEG